MCVIAYSPKGIDIPTEEQIKQMWSANPDGAGYAYTTRNGVKYSKGFMTVEELLKELEPQRAHLKHTEFGIHFRIGTSGKNDKHTTHPFPVTTKYHELRQVEGTVPAVLFHNGVVAQGGLADKNSSDTQDFTIAMAPLLNKYTHSKTRDYFIEELLGTSKLLILYKGNRVKMYGKWEKDGELYVSNTYYQYKSSGYSRYSAYYDDDYEYDGWWRDYWHAPKVTEEKKSEEDGIALAEKLLDEIEQNSFAYTTPEGIKALKNEAEFTTTALMEFEDFTLGYDDTNCLVWLEPDETKKKMEEYNAIYG